MTELDVPVAILLKFGPEIPFLRNPTCVGRTDGLTDGRTDTPSYRDARTHLKTNRRSYRKKKGWERTVKRREDLTKETKDDIDFSLSET